jgi:cell division protein FtsQ
LVLAHNSVDRDLMARDSIELTQYDPVVPSRGKSRALSLQLRGESNSTQHSSFSIQPDQEDRVRGRAPKRGDRRALDGQDDSELLTNREDLNREDFELDDLDSEEAQFLRTNRRVPVRRSPIPKKAASWLKIAGMLAVVVVLAAGLRLWAISYAQHSWRFRIESSDLVEITGVRNASRAHVMEVAGADIGRNIFFVPLDERKKQLEQIPWVEHASVMRLLPNRLSFTVEERTPVAFAQIGSRINLIDANGFVMGMPANRQTKYSFPVIRGIAETEPLSSRAAAMKIYNRLVSELGSDGAQGEGAGANGSSSAESSGSVNGGINASTNGPTNYVRQLSEVDLSDPEDVKVTANDPGGTMVVHLGAQDFLARYKLYVTHIAEWRQQFQNVQSVDLRYEGQVIVNPDKPSEKNPPRRHGDTEKTGAAGASAKPVLKSVNAKTTVKSASQKANLKPVNHKVSKPKEHLPQRTQRAQR